MPISIKNEFFILTVILVVVAMLAGSLPPGLHDALLREGGPIETASALTYLLGAGYLLWQGRTRLALLWPAALVLVHLAVREAGLRSALLGGSGLSLAYYLNGSLPPWQREAAALVLLATVLALYRLSRQLPECLRALRRGDGAAWWLVGALALGVFAQLFDKWSKLFGAAAPALTPFLLAWEEVFELGMGIGMLAAIYHLLPAESRRTGWRLASHALLLVGVVLWLTGCANRQPPPLAATSVQAQFVQHMLPQAQPAAEKLGVAPELIVAHAALESGWGQRPIRHPDGRDSHNLFSLKATPSWQGDTVEVLTTEFLRGRKVKRTERFRVYGSFGEAFDDYADLLGGLSRYQAVQGVGQNAEAFACALRLGGYATDPAYVGKLLRVNGTLRELLSDG